MCEASLETKYTNLVSGNTTLESHLHSNLLEHITSEICLGTIKDVRTAKAWLKNSFFFQRIRKNPTHYAEKLGKVARAAQEGQKQDEDGGTLEERLDRLVTQSVETLRRYELIEMKVLRQGDEGEFQVTDFGNIMSRVGLFRHLLVCCPYSLLLNSIISASQQCILPTVSSLVITDVVADETHQRSTVKCYITWNCEAFSALVWNLFE